MGEVFFAPVPRDNHVRHFTIAAACRRAVRLRYALTRAMRYALARSGLSQSPG